MAPLEHGGTARFAFRAPPDSVGTALLIAGLNARVLEDELFEALTGALLARRVAVLRCEWAGPEAKRSLTSDVEAMISALDRSGAATSPRCVFGHSLGALTAALVCGATKTTGLVVVGAAASRWADALGHAAQRQLPWLGLGAADLEREVSAARALYLRTIRDGASLDGGELFGAPLSYLRSIDAVEPALAFARVGAPVLALQGQWDLAVAAGDHERIAGFSAHPKSRARTLAGVDHYLRGHASEAASAGARGKGSLDPSAIEAITDALRAFLVTEMDG